MQGVRDIPELANVPVLVRSSLNVPVENGRVVDEYRLQKARATLAFLSAQGARVVVASHLDPPAGQKATGAETLKPVADALAKLLARVSFFPETTGGRSRAAVRALAPGDILVLENLRRDPGEVKNDPAFARELAALADVFVEDSFDTCHRAHASIVGVPALLPSYAGIQVTEEVAALTGALAPKSPSLAVVGGAKFSTKEPVLEALLERYDRVAVGGALANDFLKGAGHPVGKSLVSDTDPARVQALLAHPKLVLPVDVIVADAATPGRALARAASLDAVGAGESILDLGPGTQELLARLAGAAKSALWNGPLGNYEHGFTDATDALARAIAESGAHSVVGGGDTLASIENLGLMDRFSFVSTGGGAMLEFLVKGTLPGIEALDAYRKA